MTESQCNVLHCTVSWLKHTENWLYREILSLPGSVTSYVVCERLLNSESYPFPRLRNLQDESIRCIIPDKALRRLGIRDHLEFTVRVGRQSAARILHSHFGHVGWANIGAARKARMRHVVSFYGTDVSRLPRIEPKWVSRYRDLFSSADLVLCEGSHMAASLEALGCPTSKLRLNRLGVPVTDIVPSQRGLADGEKFKILLSATFVEKKGLPDAIAALGLLKRTGVEFALTLVGDATREYRSQREKFKIMEALRVNDLIAQTRLLGFIPRSLLLKEAYGHHVFLSPSRTASDGDTEGGAPVTLIEMSATGMPIVSTRHCDIPSVVLDGVTGLLSDEGDIEDLCAHLRTLALSPELLRQLGAAGRTFVERELDSSRLGVALARIYQTII